jgi:hypothetical protein
MDLVVTQLPYITLENIFNPERVGLICGEWQVFYENQQKSTE